jgi:hemerythrin
MTLGAEPSSSGLYAALYFHHARLEASGRHVLSTLRLEGPAAARGAFKTFKCELEAHLEAEERWVLPGFARAEPEAYEAIREEHMLIRQMSESLTWSAATVASDERTLHELVDLLLAHCRREEQTLYRWAETAIGEPESRAVLQKIEAAELEPKKGA